MKIKRKTLRQIKILCIISGILSAFLAILFRSMSDNISGIGAFIVLFIFITGIMAFFTFHKKEELEEDERGFRYSDKGTYGTARLLTTEDDVKDVALVQDAAHARGDILGQLDDSGNRIINELEFNPKLHINKHKAIFGASSSGKTHTYVKNSVIQAVRRRESLILTDPKGELYEDTSEYLRDNGYIVRRFDLKDLEKSDGWDVLKEIRESPERAEIFASVITSNLGKEDTDLGALFKSLIKAITLRIGLDDRMKESGLQNIGQVYELISNPEGEAFLDSQFDPSMLTPKCQACIGPYMSFKQGSPNLRGVVLSNVSGDLGVFQSDLVKKVLSTDDIDLALPAKKPCAYFVMMSDQHSTYKFLSALFFTFLFIDIIEYADSRPNRKCDVPVNFILDEFANSGKISDFDKKVSTVRSRAVNISIIIQDINQMANVYERTYKSIIANCATHLAIGINDPETAKFFSERAGTATIQVRTEQHERHESSFRTEFKHSTGEGKRQLFSPDELQTLGMDECVIVWQSKHAMKAKKFPFTQHPESSRFKKVNAADYPDIEDTEARAKLREKERVFIEEYEAKLASGYNPFAYFGASDEECAKREERHISDEEELSLSDIAREAIEKTKRAKKNAQEKYTQLKSNHYNKKYFDEDSIVKVYDEDSESMDIEAEMEISFQTEEPELFVFETEEAETFRMETDECSEDIGFEAESPLSEQEEPSGEGLPNEQAVVGEELKQGQEVEEPSGEGLPNEQAVVDEELKQGQEVEEPSVVEVTEVQELEQESVNPITEGSEQSEQIIEPIKQEIPDEEEEMPEWEYSDGGDIMEDILREYNEQKQDAVDKAMDGLKRKYRIDR